MKSIMKLTLSNVDIPEDVFVLIEASKLSLEDKFMMHDPKTKIEINLKEALEEVIKCGVKDFWRPRFDPAFIAKREGICYVVGNRPAVGRSYDWWENTAKAYNPKRRSRLGMKSEYVAFLGVLIKTLVSEGWTVTAAWNAVCNNSKELGHYRNSENALHDLEPTGSRGICGFYDLGNTYKILANDEGFGGYWRAGGDCNVDGNYDPLARLYYDYFHNIDRFDSVGWLVLEEGGIAA